MATRKSQIDRMQEILREMLKEHASQLLLERLQARLPDATATREAHRECFGAIRTAIRMFIDDDLAEEVHERLLTEAGLKDRG